MSDIERRITPVILSGGTGTRLWPLSRETFPKQLLPLASDRSMLQETALRVADRKMFNAPIVIANVEHRFVIAEQLRELGINDATIVLEPVGRNTTAAAATAALIEKRRDKNGLILLLAADHVVQEPDKLTKAIRKSLPAAQAGHFVLFGVEPTEPATGYGYIQRSARETDVPGTFAVQRFVEKPDAETARSYIASGDYLWNSAIFLLPANVFLKELERLAPEVLSACCKAIDGAREDLDFIRLDEASFAESPSIAIDYAVMEKTELAVVTPTNCGWTDVGSWSALWAIDKKDADNNALVGDVVAVEAKGCYLRGEGQLIAALGVEDLVVVATPDVVLVTRKDRDQDVKLLVERLRKNGHAAATKTVQVHRPWGYYQSIHTGERFQVKRITVNPGAKLSLQKHFHRAEHWVVVNGTALVTRNDEQVLLRENESIFLPLGCVHRLENPGKLPLNLIEVQSGPYLGEDDIVRIEDIYARTDDKPAN
ncbi:mannose-1-phosphate guanylyltransferase/mannose-6-phosphate isomerase [Pseudochelatococcus sp. G4_1912]|uniref:mannose-1-phosphate guanylyltransferase/mannose-6-phosphate isomerase n=1 Tax=Pseudochelatococcus sp. G4_1912 TaxID=3114288 RepID=UPI0039C5E747